MNKEELKKRIDALTFAMTEVQLFLDTHPECREALDYYKRLMTELDEAMEEYQKRYEPLYSEAAATDRWSWINGPWPWQRSGDAPKDGRELSGDKPTQMGNESGSRLPNAEGSENSGKSGEADTRVKNNGSIGGEK